MTLGRHARLVVEDAAEMLAVGKHLRLQRQEGTTGIDEIDTRQPIVERHLLGAEVFLDGEGIVRATLDCRVVGHDEDIAAGHPANPGHEACARRLVVVDVPGGKRRQLEKGRLGIEQLVDALANGKLALGAMPFDVFRAATLAGHVLALAQLVDQPLHPRAVGAEGLGRDVDVRSDGVHSQC